MARTAPAWLAPGSPHAMNSTFSASSSIRNGSRLASGPTFVRSATGRWSATGHAPAANGLLVDRHRLHAAALPAQAALCRPARRRPEQVELVAVGQQVADDVRELVRIACGRQHDAVAERGDLLRAALVLEADRGDPAGEGLGVRDAECLVLAGKGHHVAAGQLAQRGVVLELAEEV